VTCDEVFDALSRDETDLEKKKLIDAHLEGCEECRTMQEALAAYDDARANPGKYPGDPPHVKKAILDAGHKMADQYRREHQRKHGGPGEVTRLSAPAAQRRAPPWGVLLAASLLVGIGLGVPLGRLTVKPEEETKGEPPGFVPRTDDKDVAPIVTPRR